MASKKPSKGGAASGPPGYQTRLPKSTLSKYTPEEDSEDDGPPQESRARNQKPQASRGRGGYGSEDSEEAPPRDRRGGKQKASGQSSRRDDRRARNDSDDDDRYGQSRRDNGNRARDRRESRSRSRSRSRNRGGTTAMVRRGESSRVVSKRDDRSRDTGSSRKKKSRSDDEEDEEVIKISRFAPADFEELDPAAVEEICHLLAVRASKVKQWCDRDLIRVDKTTGHLDVKRLTSVLDDDDARKLKRFMKKLEDTLKTDKIIGGGQSSHHGHDHNTYYDYDPEGFPIIYHHYHHERRVSGSGPWERF